MKNILVIVVDALRADHVGCYGHERDTTPTIDSLAEDGIKYERATAPAANTWDSSLSFFTGRLPSQIDTTTPLITDHLDHTTGVFSANSFLTYEGFFDGNLDHYFCTHGDDIRGLNVRDWFRRHNDLPKWKRYLKFGAASLSKEFPWTVRNGLRFKLKSRQTEHNGGPDITRETIEFVETTDEPWFCYCHYAEAHMRQHGPSPYTVPRGYRGIYADHHDPIIDTLRDTGGPVEYTQEQIEAHRDCYDEAIRYVDDEVKSILKHIGDDTIVVVTADHGELIGEHGFIAHGYLFEPCLNVPLVIRHPTWESNLIDGRLSTRQVLPSILDGRHPSPEDVVITEDFSEGRDWKSWNDDQPDIAVYEDEWKLIREGDDRMLYNLTADVGETDDLSDEHPGLCADLEQHHDDVYGGRRPTPSGVSDIAEKRLADLGYVSGDEP